jgi:hypothetical protein
MKITIEDIKAMNVGAYIDWLIEETNKIELARLLLPIKRSQEENLALKLWNWHTYEISKMTVANIEPSCWYKKYDVLVKSKLEKIKREIEQCEDNLCWASALASSEDSMDIIKDFRKGGDSDINLAHAQIVDYDELRIKKDTAKHRFCTFVEDALGELDKCVRFDANATERALREGLETDFMFAQYIMSATFCREFFYNLNACFEFAKLEYLHRLSTWGEVKPIDKPRLEWDNKTELGQLIRSLYLTKRIRENGIPITQAALTTVFENIFGFKIGNLSQKIKKTSETNKYCYDGRHYIRELCEAFDEDLKQKAGKSSTK